MNPTGHRRRPQAVLRSKGAARLVVALSCVAPSLAQEADPPPQATFTEEQQITSVDLRVGFDLNRFNKWASSGDGAGPRLDPEDFVLRLPGRDVEVAAIDRSGDAAVAPEEIGWQVLIYFDAALNHSIGIRWAAAQLTEQVTALVDLGRVEIIVADPAPRVRLEATRDADRIVEALSNVPSFEATGDDLLLGLREEFVAVTESESDEIIAELAPHFAAAETDIILRQQDLLLDHLIAVARPAAGRLLIYVTQGFDSDPTDFYPISEATEPLPNLADETRDWARSIAAYGWTVVPIEPKPRRPLLVRGFRLGKWRFYRKGALVGASREEERDPELARAFAQLAATKEVRGDLAGAVADYERAIHHFYYDPRTSEEQALIWIELADLHRQEGALTRSRLAVEKAIELDPSLETELSQHLGAFVDPSAVLARLADESGGHRARSREELRLALHELSRRQRLTYQFRGLSTGELMELELSLRSAPERTIRYGRWSRSGTPRRASDARLRLYLNEAADEPGGTLSHTATLRFDDTPNGSRIAVHLPVTDGADHRRVLVGFAQTDRPATLYPLARSELRDRASTRWQSLVGGLEELEELETAALYVEDLVTGEWSAEGLELEWGAVE